MNHPPSDTTAAWPARLLLLLLLIVLSGCLKPMTHVKSLSEVGAKDIIVVGRIELVPPLKPGEQDIQLMGPYNDENNYFLLINSKPVEVAENLASTPYEDIMQAEFGSTYYVKNPRRPMHLSVMFIYMTLTRQKQERVWLPGGLVVEPKPKDRAVYIGTIRYHRNEFFDLTKAVVVDEFRKEQAAFRKKFGRKIRLEKRIAKVSKVGNKKIWKKK